MMTAYLVDDDQLNLKILRGLISEFVPSVQVVGEATTISDAETGIRRLSPELLFLDIEMPYGNGFELLDRLMPTQCEVIFITAYDNHAIRAIKYCALDYLLKPVNINELVVAVERAAAQRESRAVNKKLQLLSERLHARQPERIAVASMDGLEFVEMDQIIRCEAKGNYTTLYLTRQQKMVTSRPLKEFEDLLPNHLFVRIHHAHLVNINHIKKYYKGRGGSVVLDDGAELEVSVRKKDEFLSRFKAF